MRFCYLIIILFIVLSCSSSQKRVKKTKCFKLHKNNFTEIADEKYITIHNNDSISYSEIRFECINSALSTHNVMYDKFGKWNKEIYPTNRNNPILKWENIDLFSNGKKYTILTNGLEAKNHTYASVMVFDNNETDVLSSSSEEKEAIKKLFADLIKNQVAEKNDFYEAYWKEVNPEHWKKVKKYLENKQ
jgi:hypothetical protein